MLNAQQTHCIFSLSPVVKKHGIVVVHKQNNFTFLILTWSFHVIIFVSKCLYYCVYLFLFFDNL